MQPASVVYNPFAGRGRLRALLPRILEGLRRSGYEARESPTRRPGDAEPRAREAAANGAQVIFALGGDGTLRECAAGLLGTEAALAFLPAGTMNVMALELGIPSRPERAALSYAGARELRFGVGLANGTAFLMQVSAGVDAFLIGSLRATEKRRLGRLSVLPAVLRCLARYRFPGFSVTSASGSHRVTLAVASNIVRYGGPFRLTPRALSDGASLELFLFSGRGRAAAIRFALSLLLGRHLRLAGSSVERVEEAVLDAGPEVPLQLDGDLLALERGRRLEIAPAATTIRMLVPGAG